jgi:hypothetical protein
LILSYDFTINIFDDSFLVGSSMDGFVVNSNKVINFESDVKLTSSSYFEDVDYLDENLI